MKLFSLIGLMVYKLNPLALSFLTLIDWAVFKAYHPDAVMLLNAGFYLMHGKNAGVETAGIDGKQNMKISMSQ